MSVSQKFFCIFGTYNLSEGIRVDPFKTNAITKMSKPQSLTELQRFLGMVNYLGKFIPNLVEVTAQLRSFWKRAWFFICRIPVRRYWKVKNFHYVSSYSKHFRSKLTKKIKNSCKFWRIRSSSQTKPWLVRKPTMSSNRIFVPHFVWLREIICLNWRRDSLYKFWSRTFPQIFTWS